MRKAEEVCCEQHGPVGGYACTREPGHDGPHVAEGPDGEVFDAWFGTVTHWPLGPEGEDE